MTGEERGVSDEAARPGQGTPAGVFSVHLSGEIDMAREHELSQICDALQASGDADAWVDLHEVSFMDSTGLSLISRLHRICSARGGRVRLLGPQPSVARVLDIVDFPRIMDVVPPSPVENGQRS